MRISKEKREKIFEQILLYLFQESPKPLFTSYVAKEIARDEEFTKNLLKELKEKKLVLEVNKNKEGTPYIKRARWKLSEAAYNTYKGKQDKTPSL